MKSNKEQKHSHSHDEEHAFSSRRSFLKNLGILGGGSMMLGNMSVSAGAAPLLQMALNETVSDRILVLIRLKGGNDGMNTVIPLFDYDFYANARPTIKIPENQVINLNGAVGIPNTMQNMMPLWDGGGFKVIQSVGYPDQNLSHFRSTDIWSSASDANVIDPTGWMGRLLESQYPDYMTNPPAIPPAVQIGGFGNLSFINSNNDSMSMVVSNPEQLYEIAQNGELYDTTNLPDCFYGEQIGFLNGVVNSTFTYAEAIHNAYQASTNAVDYDSDIGNQLAMVARMIKGSLGTKLYMVTMDGYDTHAGQDEKHPQLMLQLSKAVKDFYEDLETSGLENQVLGMTFSEFGRRIQQNASNGTDHGAASPLLMFGGGLNGQGIIGDNPDYQNLDANGNLNFDIDFRRIYATVLEQWLCIGASAVDEIMGQYFERIDLGFDCIDISTTNPNHYFDLNHKVLYDGQGQTQIQFTLKDVAKVSLSILDISGRLVKQHSSVILLGGTHNLDTGLNARQVANGLYIYRLNIGGRDFSGKLVVK